MVPFSRAVFSSEVPEIIPGSHHFLWLDPIQIAISRAVID